MMGSIKVGWRAGKKLGLIPYLVRCDRKQACLKRIERDTCDGNAMSNYALQVELRRVFYLVTVF